MYRDVAPGKFWNWVSAFVENMWTNWMPIAVNNHLYWGVCWGLPIEYLKIYKHSPSWTTGKIIINNYVCTVQVSDPKSLFFPTSFCRGAPKHWSFLRSWPSGLQYWITRTYSASYRLTQFLGPNTQNSVGHDLSDPALDLRSSLEAVLLFLPKICIQVCWNGTHCSSRSHFLH